MDTVTPCHAPPTVTSDVPLTLTCYTLDPTACDDCHRDRQHQPRLVTRPPGGPTCLRWESDPAAGLIKLVCLFVCLQSNHNANPPREVGSQTAGWLSLNSL